MPRFRETTKRTHVGDQLITEKWSIDSKLEFILDEGDAIANDVFQTMSRSYERKAPKDTGELARGYVERDGWRQDDQSRQSLFSLVPYAGFVEYGAPGGEKLGLLPSLIRSARVKLRKEVNSRIIAQISD